mmetsp:Transcript_58787/g.126337  ORF Transcript_58787/g.126337 Transcript_58787/m.126337 type:complete len:210 (+) Transcript_58787:281-910(+)
MSKSGAAARLRRPWMLATEPSTEFMRCMSEARSAPSYRAHSTSSCRHSLTQNWSSSGSGGCGGCGTSSSSSSSPQPRPLPTQHAKSQPPVARQGLAGAAAMTTAFAFLASAASCNFGASRSCRCKVAASPRLPIRPRLTIRFKRATSGLKRFPTSSTPPRIHSGTSSWRKPVSSRKSSSSERTRTLARVFSSMNQSEADTSEVTRRGTG